MPSSGVMGFRIIGYGFKNHKCLGKISDVSLKKTEIKKLNNKTKPQTADRATRSTELRDT